MSWSLPVFLAQDRIIAIGKIEANMSDISSIIGNCHGSLTESAIQIIKNSGIETIGGFVNADIVFASLNLLFISIILNFKCIKYITFKMVINAKSYNNY